MRDEDRAAEERERAVIAHRRAAKARRWSLSRLRLNAAMRYAREAEAGRSPGAWLALRTRRAGLERQACFSWLDVPNEGRNR